MDPNQIQQAPPVQQPDVQTVPQSPSEPSHRSFFSKKFIIILVAFILVLLILFGTYAILNSQTNNQPQTPTPSPLPSIASATEGTPDPTANWKIYTNEKYGFSFKYPGEIQINRNEPATENTIFLTSEYKEPFSNYLNITLQIFPKAITTDLSTWIKGYVMKPLPNNTVGSIVEGEIKPYQNNTIDGFSFTGGIETEDKYIIFSEADDAYVIALSESGTGASYTENPNGEKVLDQILSTFKFTGK